ncbi:MAG TPA: hypothetical protein VFP84_37555, partial [Kofleriaceae bacterium]|nr:hypothetical protein [Kofleriaceae bacterium]
AMAAPATVADPPARRARWPIFAVGALVVCAGAAAMAYVALGGRDVPPPTPVAAPVPAPAPPVAVAPPPPPAPAPAPTTITLKLEVDASNATITLDGKKVAAGELTVERDAAPHALHITAPGRVAHDETLRFDENQRLSIQLPHAAAPARGNANPGKGRVGHDVVTDSPYN